MTVAINIREIDLHTADCFRRGAMARQITQAAYLGKLLGLHFATRVKADAGDTIAQELLASVSLETVSV